MIVLITVPEAVSTIYPLHLSLYNRWKAVMKEYLETIHALAGRVTDHLAASVGVDPAVVKGCFSDSMSALRLIHYSSEVWWGVV